MNLINSIVLPVLLLIVATTYAEIPPPVPESEPTAEPAAPAPEPEPQIIIKDSYFDDPGECLNIDPNTYRAINKYENFLKADDDKRRLEFKDYDREEGNL